MVAGLAARQRTPSGPGLLAALRADAAALVPGAIGVALMLVWAVHNGGFDADTWYWGALALLSLLAVMLVVRRAHRRPLPRLAIAATAAFGLYVAWSFLSMTWAQVPGEALDGSNRVLLYLIVFTLFLVLPWTPTAALLTVTFYAIGVGVIAIVLELRLASGYQLAQLVVQGRLAAPTGYFNSTVALFMSDALLAAALASRSELPAPLRGALLTGAAASLQLCLLGQSRGWLFTLPLVLLVAILIVRDRLRVGLLVMLPICGVLLPLHRLLNVFAGGGNAVTVTAATRAAAQSAAHTCLLLCASVFVLGTLICRLEAVPALPRPSARMRRQLGAAVAVLALVAAVAGGIEATGGHPIRFVEDQWNGFSRESSAAQSVGSHFAAIGSGRYDFWRVALDAFVAHPLDGIGQDNFADYYILHRQTDEDPLWPHSLELRLLAMTGIVGLLLFFGFLALAIAAAIRTRRGGSLAGAVAGIALLPLVVWVIHGSVDWFFEIPALSGPALGFLGMAAGLSVQTSPAAGLSPATPPGTGLSPATPPGTGLSPATPPAAARSMRPARRPVAASLTLICGLVAATVALTFPYLSVREVSLASDATNSQIALADLKLAAQLDPWNPEPGRMAGQIALQAGDYRPAELSFDQTIAREPDGWYAWLGAGLAASALGDAGTANHDFRVAASIDNQDPVIRTALAMVLSAHPLAPANALTMLAAESGV